MGERTKRQSPTQSSGSFRGIYVPKSVMEAVFPGAHDVLPESIRDRIPTLGRATAAHAAALRSGFTVLKRFIDELFKRLEHTEGEEWEQWKLLVACYAIEREVGPNALRGVGQKLARVEGKTLPEAVRSLQSVFQEQQCGMSPKLIGGWSVAREKPGEITLEDSSFYPCALHEGVISSYCDTFAKSFARYSLLSEPKPKRQGGAATHYILEYNA